MTIGIDARLYGTRHRGIGRYIEKLIENLEKIDSENQYVVFLQKSNFNEYQPKNPNFKRELADFRAYSIKEQVIFPRILKKHQFNLVHFPHFNVPIFYRGKFVVTIHDLIISHYPDSRATTLPFWLYQIKLFFYRLILNSAAKKANKIIAVSGYTKEDIVNLLHVGQEQVVVTYEGVGIPAVRNENCAEALNNLGILGDYLLYVGSAYPHKNLEKLISAFKIVETHCHASLPNNLKLVLAGRIDLFYERLKNNINDKNIIFTGELKDEQLFCLYKNAKAYVFPSLMEGFGLPPLEAQSQGCPVISANSSCLPEILGDSAVYFDPGDIYEMAIKIESVLDDKILRDDLIEKGYENVKKYLWEDCAKKTLVIYLLSQK
ncbi:MAG: glycosyltransferase family 1 protein [Patescibacteria group bacterium]